MPRRTHTEQDYSDMYHRFENDMLKPGKQYTLKEITLLHNEWMRRDRSDKFAPKRPTYATQRQHERIVREAKHEGSLMNTIEKRVYSYVRNGKMIQATQYRNLDTGMLSTKAEYEKEMGELDEY